MAHRISFPIPPGILDTTLKVMPVLIAVLSSMQQTSDYFFSGSFLRAAQFLPSCCEEFDFIIVGGGSAGSVLAARLSENPKIRVLLIEAGGDPNLLSYIPAAVSSLSNHPSIDWEYRTVKQNGSAFGILNQEVPWPRSKSLGGSSNANFMIYMKGNPRDFDRWAEHTGDSRWKYRNVDKYFRKIEDYFGHWNGNGFHDKGGPLRVEPLSYHPGMQYILDAAEEVGYGTRDLNGDQAPGFSPVDFTTKRGMRFSTYRAYIKPSLHRPNLVIYRYTLATKIHLNALRRAVGVTYLRHGVEGYASASKEIIVCGGTINSPQLLMLSGIGPQAHLHEVGIDPIVDLPVGQNLQDHVTTTVGPFLLNQSESFMLHRDVDVGSLFDYVKSGTGPLSSALGISAIGLVSTTEAASPDWPDIMYTVTALGIFRGLPELLDQVFRTGSLAQQTLASYVGTDNHVVLATLGTPKSRGYIRLRNKNPLSRPIINPRYYSDPGKSDIKAMVKGIEIMVKMYENTTSLQKLNAHLPRNIVGCENFRLRSEEYYECNARTVTLTLYHPTSTCSMGREDDPNSVVDSQLRVKGVKGLRVADASVMPYVTNTNTNAPTILIGEMCSDMVKQAWKIG